MELPYDPAISLLGNISGEKHGSKLYMCYNVHCSTAYNSRDTEATKVFADRGMHKEDMVHIDNGILLSHTKEWKIPFAATWMDMEIHILSEVSQRETNTIWYFTYVESKNTDANEIIYKTKTDL